MPARWHDPSAPAKHAQMAFAYTVNVIAWIVWIALVVSALIYTAQP